MSDICVKIKNNYCKYIIQNFSTWKNCKIKAVVVGAREFTYSVLYKMICCNIKKIKVHGKILALCNENSLSFIVDLVTIMVTGNIPLIVPYYLHEDGLERVKIECNALTYRNSDIKELLNFHEEDREYVYKPRGFSGDIAMFIFSSGTTAKEKMIPISYKSLYYRICYTEKYFERKETYRELFLAPLSSALGLQHQLFPCLAKKCTIILYEGLMNPRKIVDLVYKYQIRYLSLVPSVLKCIYTYCLKKKEQLPTVEKIFVCGEKSDAEFLREIWQYFKTAKLYQAYGMSEILPISIQYYEKKEDIVENCVGKIIEEVRLKIVEQDENGVGEICVANSNIIDNYYDTIESFEWLNTGDIGYVDDKQFLYIIGRKKNMVIVNGNKIYTEQIESIAEKFCGIDEVRAIGLKDNLRGETILLQIKLRDDNIGKIKFEELRGYIYQNLHIPNVSITIQIVKHIEKTHNLKKRR